MLFMHNKKQITMRSPAQVMIYASLEQNLKLRWAKTYQVL